MILRAPMPVRQPVPEDAGPIYDRMEKIRPAARCGMGCLPWVPPGVKADAKNTGTAVANGSPCSVFSIRSGISGVHRVLGEAEKLPLTPCGGLFLPRRLLILRVCSGDCVDHPFGNVGCVVGNPLQIFGDHQKIDQIFSVSAVGNHADQLPADP